LLSEACEVNLDDLLDCEPLRELCHSLLEYFETVATVGDLLDEELDDDRDKDAGVDEDDDDDDDDANFEPPFFS